MPWTRSGPRAVLRMAPQQKGLTAQLDSEEREVAHAARGISASLAGHKKSPWRGSSHPSTSWTSRRGFRSGHAGIVAALFVRQIPSHHPPPPASSPGLSECGGKKRTRGGNMRGCVGEEGTFDGNGQWFDDDGAMPPCNERREARAGPSHPSFPSPRPPTGRISRDDTRVVGHSFSIFSSIFLCQVLRLMHLTVQTLKCGVAHGDKPRW